MLCSWSYFNVIQHPVVAASIKWERCSHFPQSTAVDSYSPVGGLFYIVFSLGKNWHSNNNFSFYCPDQKRRGETSFFVLFSEWMHRARAVVCIHFIVVYSCRLLPCLSWWKKLSIYELWCPIECNQQIKAPRTRAPAPLVPDTTERQRRQRQNAAGNPAEKKKKITHYL